MADYRLAKKLSDQALEVSALAGRASDQERLDLLRKREKLLQRSNDVINSVIDQNRKEYRDVMKTLEDANSGIEEALGDLGNVAKAIALLADLLAKLTALLG